MSLIKLCLMNESSGVSVVKLGVWFTSNKMGLMSLVNMMSKPRMWKHMLPAYSSGWQYRYWCLTSGKPLMNVLIMRSFIFLLT